MRILGRIKILALVVVGLCNLHVAAMAQVYRIVDLGTVAAGAGCYPAAINAHGDVVGQCWPTAIGSSAFLYRNGQITDLGTLSGASRAVAINDAGQIVGDCEMPNSHHIAFLWQGGSMTQIDTPNGPASFAWGINAHAEIVGSTGFNDTSRAYRWAGGVAEELPMPAGASRGGALYTNYLRDVFCFFDDPAGEARYLYRDGAMQRIDSFLPSGYQGTFYPLAINDLGQIMGKGAFPGQNTEAMILDHGVLNRLGNLGGEIIQPLGFNNLGEVTGYLRIPPNPNGPFRPFLYSRGRMWDVSTFLPANSGWILDDPTAINDDGLIAGDGRHSGLSGQRGFLLIPFLHLTGMTVSPAGNAGSKTVTGKVTLSGPAPAGGVVVSLSSTLQPVSMPATVTVPAKKTSVTFVIKTVPVSTATTGLVMGSINAETAGAALTVRPIAVQTLTLAPNPVRGGGASTATITLEGAAAPGDIIVSLSTSNTHVAAVPASVVVPRGSATATFPVNTSAVAVNTSVSVKATVGTITKSAILTVSP